MKIGTRTKISDILRHNTGAVEAIAAINPHFNKLRNPVLRRVLAPRVTVADAARIGKCAPSDILERLRAIGFDIEDETTPAAPGAPAPAGSMPGPVDAAIGSGQVRVLDVRPVLEGGKDPFQQIMAELKTLPDGHALEVVNSFEPVPLIAILDKQGFSSRVEHRDDAVHTFFLKTGPKHRDDAETGIFRVSPEALEAEKTRYQGRCREIDVRDLEMPLPMMTILSELETLPAGKALYVHHKKVPQYLLPELSERRYETWIAEVGEGNVKMLIKR